MTSSANSDPCLFCAIAAGTAESSPVYEDEDILAFMDIQPVTTGHVIVIPKAHSKYLEEMTETLGAHLFRVAHRMARSLRHSTVPCEGVNIFLADGEAAFQEVLHVHLHVFPRTLGDGFRIDANWRLRERPELDRTAALVREGLAALPTATGTR